jgi:hypothetical protein
MFGESFVVESRRVRSAMCGGSIRGRWFDILPNVRVQTEDKIDDMKDTWDTSVAGLC